MGFSPSRVWNMIDPWTQARGSRKLLGTALSLSWRSHGPRVANAVGRRIPWLLVGWLQDLERAQQALIHTHHGAGIVELTTVIRSREQRYQLSLGEEFVTIFHHLVGSAYQIHIVFLKEAGYHVGTERKGDTSVVFGPARDVLVWIRPQQVTQQTDVGNIRWSHDSSDLLHGVQVGRQTAVHCEDFLVNDGCNGQAVEAVCERLPQFDVVPSFALIVETVDSVDGRALVIASQDEEVLGVLDFICQQKADGFKGLFTSVNVVSQEQVIGFGWEASILEKSQ